MIITHRDLVFRTQAQESTIAWLQEIHVNPINKECISCNNYQMRLVSYKKTFHWKCTRCSKAVSIFEKTILFNTKMELIQLLDLIYFWSRDLTQTKVKHELELNPQKSICDWYKKLQKLSYVIMRDELNDKIGDPGHVVEVDKSKFSKRKYQVGRIVMSPWVVGGIDINTKECFFVEVINRSADILKGIILERIHPGTLIITDEWRGYWGLENMGYFHLTVNHSENFVCPNTGANTQPIENTWGWMKRRIRNK